MTREQCLVPVPRRVVIADPSPSSAFLGHEFRELGSGEVWFAESIAEACEVVAAVSPDLLVHELRFPDHNGFELLREVAERSPGTRCVVLTSFGSATATVRALRLGAVTCLEKPSNASEILSAVTLDLGPTTEERALGRAHMSFQRAMWEYVNRVFPDADSLSEAARRLGLDRRSLRRMLSRHAPA